MDLGLGLFYYTLIVLFGRHPNGGDVPRVVPGDAQQDLPLRVRRVLFYFFDVALVFQDDFLMQRASDASVSPFFIGSLSLLSSSAAARSYRSARAVRVPGGG